MFSLFSKHTLSQADTKDDVGRNGEDIAVSFLQNRGYTVVARNYRKRFGEIDIIAEDDEVLVFVEVKTRSSTLFGSPQEAVDFRKQQRMAKAALDYISTYKLFDRSARFDVVAVLLYRDRAPEIDHITNAFELRS